MQQQIVDISRRTDEPPVELFPRYFCSSAEAVLGLGTFSGANDEDLNAMVHDWIHRGTEANNRMAITEIRLMAQPSRESVKKFREELTTSEVQQAARDSLYRLTDCLLDRYSSESGIGRDTIFPPTANHPGATPP